MSFQKRVEDFICEQCGTTVKGTGYTNHCPKCLWSKHVDIAPGDRADTCRGMMEPFAVEGSTGKGYTVRHKCQKCSFERVNAVTAEDNPDAVVGLAQKRASV